MIAVEVPESVPVAAAATVHEFSALAVPVAADVFAATVIAG